MHVASYTDIDILEWYIDKHFFQGLFIKPGCTNIHTCTSQVAVEHMHRPIDKGYSIVYE